MEEYKASIAKVPPGKNGSVLFAVFRGKVSEGVDFADNQARAVISVGIPFAAVFAPDVVAKRNWNNSKKKQPNPAGIQFQSGDDWFNGAAFRAMNQAFGRCIRHRRDWGAIIILDCRLSNKHANGFYRKFVSSWLKEYLRDCEYFDEALSILKKFVKEQLGN
jgi:Fanconi anemia group J protein